MDSNPTISPEDLVGTWSLVSASSKSPQDDNNDAPYGEHPSGVLTYTSEGRVSALISYDGRKRLSMGGGEPSELAEAFRTFLAYAGRYSIRDGKVIHHVEISSIQNYVGRDLVRTLSYSGDRIVLVTPPTPINGKVRTIALEWERIT
jgi:hypothetical protein